MNPSLENIISLKTTRSNNFSGEKISNDDLDIIINASVKAPNASNRQSYSIIVLDDETKEKLRLKGDKVLLYLVDFHRHNCVKESMGKEISFNHFQPFLTGVIDVSLAVQNAVIAANSMDVSYLITNDTYTKDIEKLQDLLNLPKTGCFPLLYLCLGYPKEEVTKRKGRLDNKFVVHYGKYKKYSEQDIQEIINEYNNEELELFTKWKSIGYDSYCDWFYDKWLPSLENDNSSGKVLRRLEESGFLTL